MSDNAAFLAHYQGYLDILKAMTEKRLAVTEGHLQRVFSSHISDADHLAVLLDHDLTLIRAGRHPAGDQALLEVAHHAILLHSAREQEARRLQRSAAEREIVDAATKKAIDDIHAATDKEVFESLDQSLKAEKPKPKKPKAQKPRPKGRTPKRQKR
jgi:outer membrane biosynthesis protein TonB